MADYDQIMRALRNAHAAGDTAAATRLAAMAKTAKAQPAPAQAAPQQPAGTMQAAPQSMPDNATLQATGPGPTGYVDPALYEMGAIGRRFVPGDAQPPARPETVRAADGTEMVLNPRTGQYTSRELLAGNMRPTTMDALQAGSAQGITLGGADEMIGMVGGDFKREEARAKYEAARRDRPVTTLIGEAGGALSLPVGKGKAVKTLGEAVKVGAVTGAKVGAVYGGLTGEGGAINRLGDGIQGAVSGALIGAAAPLVVNFGTKAFRAAFKASAEKPSLANLRTAKKAAYAAVDAANEKFSPTDLAAMVDKAKAGLDDVNYLPEADVVTRGMMAKLDDVATKEITLGQLDNMRQAVWARYNASKEPGLLEIIDAIDEMVASRASSSDLMDAARLANSRFKKAELLDLAFQKAADQTASTGSGGNLLNKYRQAVTNIINNPKQAKWFSADEIATMRDFLRGTPTQNTLRLIGKLSPGGNGLMTALNLGAVSVAPGALAITAGASVAKGIADRATERGAQGLIAKVSGGAIPVPPPPISYPQNMNALAGPIADRLPSFGP